MYYLYVKTHNITGLKYLGKTISDPFKYKGSGKWWKRHLSKYGNDVQTIILLATENKTEIRDTGIFFSKLWKVTSSSEWANLVEESGEGGDTSAFINYNKARYLRNDPIVKAKREETILKKYNGAFYKDLGAKGKEATFKKYGVENPMFDESIKKKHRDKLPANHQAGTSNSQFGKKFAFVCKENICKKIPLEALDSFLEKGYQKGKKWRPLKDSNPQPTE